MSELPTAVQASFLVTALVIVGWMVFGVIQYRRTGKGLWLWLGMLMAVSLGTVIMNVPR